MSSSVKDLFQFYGCTFPEDLLQVSEQSYPLKEAVGALISTKDRVILQLQNCASVRISDITSFFNTKIAQLEETSKTTRTCTHQETIEFLQSATKRIRSGADHQMLNITRAFFDKKIQQLDFESGRTFLPVFKDSTSEPFDLTMKEVFSWVDLPFPKKLESKCSRSYSSHEAISLLQYASSKILEEAAAKILPITQGIDAKITQLNKECLVHQSYTSQETISLLQGARDQVVPQIQEESNQRIEAFVKGIDAKIAQFNEQCTTPFPCLYGFVS